MPSTLVLYGLLKEQPCGMAQKPVLQDTPGTPTGSLPNLKHLQGTLTMYLPTLASLLVGTIGVPLFPKPC